MSRLKQPVFEKPEEPDFIKRMKGTHQAAVEAAERPMTEAPVQEDELPAIANAIDQSDLATFRKSQGVAGDAATDNARVEESIFTKKSVKRDPQAQLAGLKTLGRQDDKRLKHLRDLKASLQDKGEESDERDEPPRRKLKEASKPRKKIKLSLIDDTAS